MELPKATRSPRPDSPSTLSVSSMSSSESGSPPGSPVHSICIHKPRKEFNEVSTERGRISALHAFVCLVLVSYGSFTLGNNFSSSAQLLWSPTRSAQQQQEQQQSPQNFETRDRVGEIFSSPRKTLPSRARSSQEEMAKRRNFAAHAIHPALLTVFPVPTSIAIAIDRHPNPKTNSAAGNQVAGDLLSEIVKYRALNKITVLFVDEEHESSLVECPQSLRDIFTMAGKEDIDLQCSNVNTQNSKGSPVRENHDVSLVLANCDKDEFDRERRDSAWEEDLYLATKSVAVKCVGRTYPLDHPAQSYKGISRGKSSNIDKIEHFFVPDLKVYPSADSFLHATDYDVFDERGVATNFAVAFRSIKNGLHQWRLPEANYQVAMHHRWESFASEKEQAQYFGPADMLRIQFPSRQSAVSSCHYNEHLIEAGEDDVDMFCDQGLDDQFPNVSAEHFYVGKSTMENAGRGVFASVDLKADSYLMNECYGHDVIFSKGGFGIMEGMVDAFCLPKEKDESHQQDIRLDTLRCIVGIYYDAYGYFDTPSGNMVNSGINTFINHGCDRSANLDSEAGGTGLTEFTMLPDDEDPNPETFEIPNDLQDAKLYNPNLERKHHLIRYDMVGPKDIPAHTEILDDYAAFEGDKYFLAALVALKRQCSGESGAVVNFEHENAHKFDAFGSPYIMDTDAVRHRQLASLRKSATCK